MTLNVRTLVAACALSIVSSVPAWAVCAEPAVETQATAEPWFRVVDKDDGGLSVQASVRTFERTDEKGPTVMLVPAIHIGEKPFYTGLQTLLDGQDVVLYEGVKPTGTGRAEHDSGVNDDAAKARRTKARIRFIAVAAHMHKAAHGSFPATLDELVSGADERIKPYVKGATADAWDRPLAYSVIESEIKTSDPGSEPGTFTTTKVTTVEVVSLGADGAEGGDDGAKDLKLSDQRRITPSEVPSSRNADRNLQQQLASALGLVFQLDVMHHDRANWRNSDLSMDQLQERLDGGRRGPDAGEGVEGKKDALFAMLDGTSMQAKLVKFLLGLMRVIPSAQTMGRIAMAEMITRADELLELGAGAGGMGLDKKMLDVIVHDRNAVVLSDFRGMVKAEPALKTVGIIYGGGHMPGIRTGLEDMGYRETKVEWLEAMSIQPGNGMTAKDIKQMRTSISKTLDQQVKALKRKKERAEKAKDEDDVEVIQSAD